jgi:hypothetical protein
MNADICSTANSMLNIDTASAMLFLLLFIYAIDTLIVNSNITSIENTSKKPNNSVLYDDLLYLTR